MEIHPLHPVVLIIGILFALRHMNVSMREVGDHPGVDTEAFGRWKLAATRAYRLGMSACFGKVLLDYLVAYLFRAYPPPVALAWGIGLGLDALWVFLVATSSWRVHRAHALAREIGVERPREN